MVEDRALPRADAAALVEASQRADVKATLTAALTLSAARPGAAATMQYAKDKRDELYKKQIEAVFPGYSENWVAARFMDWPNEPWTMAGYSFPAPGQVTTHGPLMAKPHAKRIHFAGEHADSFYSWQGFMEGAALSGIAAAQSILARANTR